MTLTLNRRSAYVLARWGIGIRLFTAAVVDGAALGNSGWIAILMSGVLALPLALCICFLGRTRPHAAPLSLVDTDCGRMFRRIVCLLLFALSIYDGAYGTRILALSVEYTAFERLPLSVIMLSAVVIGSLACMGGGIGLGGAAQLWNVLLLASLVFIGLSELGSFHFPWLFPLLGPGVGTLFRGAQSYAGMATALFSMWLCMSEESGHDQTGGQDYPPIGAIQAPKSVAMWTLGCAAFAVTTSMLAPSLPGAPSERDYALNHFISNGLNVTALQFPLTMVWFLAQILMLSFYIYLGACLLKQAFGRIKGGLCVGISGVLVFAAALSSLPDRQYIDYVNAIRLPVVTLIAVIIVCSYLFKQRRVRSAQQ